MADNKKITPLNVPKVKRGAKSALTPGEQPEKEKTPIEKVISREIAKIVEDINFDDKFKSIKTAIESRQSESLLPVLEKINDKLNPILGALYGISNVDNNTSSSTLLSKLGNLDPKLTMFGPIDSMLKSIYELLITQINNKSSYKLEDLASAVSAEIKKFLKEIDNRPALENLTKTLEDMKSSILSNSSAENINRIYSQLEVISNLLSNNKTIDYTVAISDVATKINSIANAISSSNSVENKDNSKLLNILNKISSDISTMSKTTSENIAQSTNVLKEVSRKLDSINTETTIIDNSLLINELKDIKRILVDDIVNNYKHKTNVINYSDTLNSINESIKNIVASNNNAQNNNQINSTIINKLNNISESITNLISSITANNTIIELQNIKNAISELSTTITNSSSITEIINKLTEITEKMSIENTNISSIEQYINSISNSISTISEINTSISSVNESIIELNRIVSNNTKNFTESIKQSANDQINLMTENISSINTVVEHISNIESSIAQLSNLVNNFSDVITNSNIYQIETISNSIKDSISNIMTENNSAINSLINELTQSMRTSIESITSNLSNLTNIDNSSGVSEISNSLTTVSNTLNELTSNVIKLTNDSNTNIANINDSIKNISTSINNVSNINKSISNAFTSLSQSLNKYMGNATKSSNISSIKDKVTTVKLPEPTSENYDSIIESINDNANSIIDIISEKFDDILDPIKKLLNTNDFNLRTAQIIDAINSSTKDVNTTALQYNININASGLDVDTIEALIDLSKISTDSIDYLENLNNVLSNLSNFEKLNNIKLDNKNIKNIVDSISALSKMNLKENTFNPLSVDSFKYFIDTLSSIDLSNIKNFDEDSLKSISVITNILSSFSKLKLENFNKNIQSLNVEEFVKLLNNLKDIPVYDKEKNNTIVTAISELFSAVSSISGFDETKFDNLSSNLNKMIKLTENNSKGLIHTLINNIDEISSETKETSAKAKNISEMLNVICNISKYDDEEFENLKYITEILVEVTNKNEPYLYRVFQNVKEIGDVISGWNTKNGPSAAIREQLKIINGFSSNISIKSALSLGIKSTIMLMSLHSLSEMFSCLKTVMESSKNANEYVKVINESLTAINSIESIDIKKIENLNESLKALIASSIYLRIFALISSKEIDISKNITVLNNVVEQLNNIKDVKSKDNLKSLNDSIKNILILNIWLSIIGVTMPLAFIGAFAINKEISMLSKIVGKLNEIQPIKEDVVNNLKSLAIVIVAASGILLLGALVGGFVSTHLLEILGFTVALSAFIFLTIGAFNIATRGMKEAKLNADEFGKLLLISGGIMLLGGAIMMLYSPLILGSMGFAIALGAFIFLTIGALNLATKGMNDAAKNAKEFAILIGISAAVMLLGGLIVTMYMPLILGSLVFTALLSLFILTTIGALNLATNGINEAAKNAKEFAILIGISAAVMLLGGLIMLNYTKIILGSLGFSLLLGAFIFLTIGALNLATKGMNEATKNAKEFAILIGISAAALLIGGLFMLIPGMPDAVFGFAWRFILFLGVILLAYAIASKHIKKAKQVAIGFGVVVLLTSMALLLGGGMFLMFPGLDMECLKFAGISALFILIFGGTIWLLGKIKKKDLIQGELALAGIAVLIAGFGYAFTFVAEAMDMISKVKDPWTQLGIMGTVFGAMVALVVGVTTLIATTGVGGLAIAAAEAAIAGIAGIIWLIGKAMSAIAQSMVDLDKVKDFDSKNVIKAIGNYISLIPELTPLASPEIVISMLAVKSSVGSMSEAILAIATSVKAVCDLKTEDGRQLTSGDFTLAAENIKSVVTILGRSLIEVYGENKDMFSSGSTIGDLLGTDTVFSRVAKSCATMGQLITDISAGVKDFANLRMPIYDGNGKIKGYREMKDQDFENAGKSVAKVVTCLGKALIDDVYKGNEKMFEWKLIGDNPFAMVSKSCLTLGQFITDISAGVKDFAELRMPIYDNNGKIKGYREMGPVDFINAGINVGLVITCLANAIMAVYNDPKNKDMFTDPSSWHTSADKTPFGMVVKAMAGVGTLVKDGAAAIKEIANMKVDFADLEDKVSGNTITKYGKVSKIVTIIARSIKNAYDLNKDIFTDKSFWHTDPQKTPFGMVTQCLNNVIPLVKNAAAAVNDISKLNFKSTDLDEKGELHKKINGIVSVVPKAVIDVMTDKKYKKYLTDSDYLETFENMKNVYSKFSSIIEAVIGCYDSINKLGYDGKKINSMKSTIKLMMLSLCNVITDKDILNLLDSEIFKNDKKSDKIKLSDITASFEEFNEIIEEVNTAYDSINKSLSNLGVKDNDTTVITTITSNLNTMISKLSESIKLNTISLDAKSVNSFSANVSSFYSSIETLTRAYNLVPEDLTKYDNVVKAIERVNFKIAEIPNLEAFNTEQQTLEKYVITLNNLDLTKVETLSNLMSIMNELATKLGSLDKFTDVLNTKISTTLANLANQIKISGDIINKADSLQKQRHEAIKASIKEIQSIMDQKLIVEVNHNNDIQSQSNGGDSFTDNYNGNTETPVENNKPSIFERAGNFVGNSLTNLFSGNDSSTSKNNTSNVAHQSHNIGGIDYDRLKNVIMQAIQASGLDIDINRKHK